MAQVVKHLPAMQQTQVQSLGHEDPLEKGMAIHFSILAWRIPWTEEPGRLQPTGLEKSDMTKRLTLFTGTFILFQSSVGCPGIPMLGNLCKKPAGAQCHFPA